MGVSIHARDRGFSRMHGEVSIHCRSFLPQVGHLKFQSAPVQAHPLFAQEMLFQSTPNPDLEALRFPLVSIHSGYSAGSLKRLKFQSLRRIPVICLITLAFQSITAPQRGVIDVVSILRVTSRSYPRRSCRVSIHFSWLGDSGRIAKFNPL